MPGMLVARLSDTPSPSLESADGVDEPAEHQARAAARRAARPRQARRPPPGRRADAARSAAATSSPMADARRAHRQPATSRSAASPAPAPLLDALAARAASGAAPDRCCADFDLDWAAYEPGALRDGPVRPARADGAARSGVDAIARGRRGVLPGRRRRPRRAPPRPRRRLLRPGAGPDRARAPRCLLVYDDEVLDAVPTEQHDQRVDVIVTPRDARPPRRAVRVAGPDGSSVSVSSAGASTASRREGPGSVSPRGPQLGLVGVVGVVGVAGRAGQVDPARARRGRRAGRSSASTARRDARSPRLASHDVASTTDGPAGSS